MRIHKKHICFSLLIFSDRNRTTFAAKRRISWALNTPQMHNYVARALAYPRHRSGGLQRSPDPQLNLRGHFVAT